jgi:SNF2 family DNA or RNA helicase
MELRPYQTEAVERIVERGNLLLALVMGAGKTATAISAVRRLRRLRLVDRGVVFAPKSVKLQWAREISKWDPRASVQVIDGSKPQRNYGLRHADEYHYSICHYQMLVNDWDEIKQWLPIDFIIADEATALKGMGTKTSKRAKILAKNTDVRLALSGQPVENRPEELFSIGQWVDPEVLGPFPKFDRAFINRDHWGKPRSYKNLDVLGRRIAPMMYRKSREDIKEWLPERIEIEVPVPLDADVMKLHDHIRADLSDAIDGALSMGMGGGGFDILSHYGAAPRDERMGAMGQVMSRLLAMRMISAHPHLLRLSAEEFDTQLSRRGSEYASALLAAGLLDGFTADTTKLSALIEMVEEILEEDPRHKVVIFSYFKPMLAMIGHRIKAGHALITGDVTGMARDRAIVRFNTDPTCRVFLSSDAGAYGVDLNQGSHVINYDLPWSGGALSQRIARIDRTNSAFDQIQVMYLYGQGTIEARMFRMLSQKAKVARAFLDGEFDAKSGGLKLDLESLREFLDSP